MGLFFSDPDELSLYGYTFKRGSLHKSPEELRRLRYTYDTTASDALDALDDIAPPSMPEPRKDIEETVEPKDRRKHRDLFKLLRENAKADARLDRLWSEVNTVPDWVDWEQIERGQKVFWRYTGPAITALTFLSLLGGMGSGRTVETLDRTGGFGAQVVRKRLMETIQHTLSVHKDLNSIKPGGEGFEASVRVRLLHASVRQRILKLVREKPDYYDVEKHGVPINDLDCMGTIGTFSATIIWLGLPRQGIYLRQQEIVDYLALWRYVGFLMGTPHEWMAKPEAAKAMMESLVVSEVHPTKKSHTLANNIITGLQGQAPTFASRSFLNAETYWLIGSELARDLNIEKPSIYHTSLVMGQCILFMITAYTNRLIPSWDEKHINFIRKVLYNVLIHNKKFGALGYETKFHFKWIPDLKNITTPLGEPTPDQSKKMGAFNHPGIERTALITLVFTGVVLGVAGWGIFRVVNSFVGIDSIFSWPKMGASFWPLIWEVKP